MPNSFRICWNDMVISHAHKHIGTCKSTKSINFFQLFSQLIVVAGFGKACSFTGLLKLCQLNPAFNNIPSKFQNATCSIPKICILKPESLYQGLLILLGQENFQWYHSQKQCCVVHPQPDKFCSLDMNNHHHHRVQYQLEHSLL